MEKMKEKVIVLVISILVGICGTYLFFRMLIQQCYDNNVIGEVKVLGIPYFVGSMVDGSYTGIVNNGSISMVSVLISLILYFAISSLIILIRKVKNGK